MNAMKSYMTECSTVSAYSVLCNTELYDATLPIIFNTQTYSSRLRICDQYAPGSCAGNGTSNFLFLRYGMYYTLVYPILLSSMALLCMLEALMHPYCTLVSSIVSMVI